MSSSAFSTYVGPPEVGTIALPVSPLSTEQYLRIIEAGILDDQKVELIGGIITAMAPAGPDHSSSLYALTDHFARVIDRFVLAIQSTMVIGEGHVFDPDFALLIRKPEGYRRLHARPGDIQLIVESAASSLKKDKHVKLPIYAAAGIQEYWIIDLDRELVLVYRQPDGATFRSEESFAGDQTIAPLACPELQIRVANIFA